jgi:hypothetical protein
MLETTLMMPDRGIWMFWRAASIALGLMAAAATAPARGQVDSDAFYQKVKDAEGQIKLNPFGTVNVGTFDAATGEFNGIVSSDEKTTDGRGKPIHIKKDAKVRLNGIRVILNFHVKNRGNGNFTVTANGKTVQAPSGATSVSIDVGKSTKANWNVNAGGKSFSDTIYVDHTLIGAGAFKLPALPIAIIYEPPMDQKNLNKASYQESHSIGTTARVGWSVEHSQTTPTSPGQFVSALEFKSQAESLGAVASKIPNPYAQAAGTVLNILATGMGSASAKSQVGSTASDDHALILNSSRTVKYTSGAKLGPGPGDAIVYLKNAKVAWVGSASDDGLNLAVLGYDSIESITVKQLQEDRLAMMIRPVWPTVGSAPPTLGPATKLDLKSVQGLLALDPFAMQGPGTKLDPKRFRHVDTYDVNGSTIEQTLAFEASQVDSWSKVNYNANVQDYSQGFLSFLGIGVTETKTLTTKLTESGSNDLRKGTSTAATVQLNAQADELYSVAVYYDTVFGTFAFQGVASGSVKISGKSLDVNGKPRSNEIVTLMIGGQKFTTRTKPDGSFAYRATTIPAGAGSVTAAGVAKTFQFAEARPVIGLELRAAK